MTYRKTLLVTGGSGYLGQHLTTKAAATFNVYATHLTHADQIKVGHPLAVDLVDRAAVLRLIRDLSPEAIIHAAAINPGGREPEMRRINVDGSRFVAEGAATVGARLIYISSDVVHNGQNAPYKDDTPPSPINDYGCSKAAAEAAVAEVDPQAAIIRTSLIYGLEKMDRGTASFVQRLKSGNPLVLFNDVIRQPVYVETLVAALLKLLDLDIAGVLNVAGRQALTREEFGRRMLAWWQVDYQGRLKSGQAAEISATIPLDLRLNVAKAQRLLHMVFPGVDEVLAMAKEART